MKRLLVRFVPRSVRRIAVLPAVAALWLAGFSPAQAGEPALERWRSYSGVTWDVPAAGAEPARFAGSVGAPIAGLHFDAQGSAFVSTPRLVSPGAPATLSRLDTQARGGPARLTAFPSVAGNSITDDPRLALRNVLGFHVDHRNGWVWALDMGFVAGEAAAPPGAQKLLVLALDTGRVVHRVPLDAVADAKGSFLNDLAVDEVRRVAYIADSGLRGAPENPVGLIVVDLPAGTARRVLHRHASLQVEAGVTVVSHGSEVWPGNPLKLGVNGVALSPDRSTLYWTVTTGTRLHAVSTGVLRDASAGDARIARQVKDLGVVGGNTDGIVTDAHGRLYITDVTRNGIVRYDPHAASMALIATDEGVEWPDTPAIGPGGDLFFTSSRLNQHFAGAVQAGQERYDIWRLPLARPVRGKARAR